MLEIKALPCYTEDWKRTHPDFIVYLPPKREAGTATRSGSTVGACPLPSCMRFSLWIRSPLHGYKWHLLTAKSAKKTQRPAEETLCELCAFFAFFAVGWSFNAVHLLINQIG